jgi:hypothetical protein
MKALIMLGIVLALGGCASLGLATAQTLDQKIAYGYAGVTAVLQTIPAAIQGGTLSSASATKANTMALQVKALLDAARAAEVSNATGALNDLNLATAALTAVQQYLTANGVK